MAVIQPNSRVSPGPVIKNKAETSVATAKRTSKHSGPAEASIIAARFPEADQDSSPLEAPAAAALAEGVPR